MSHLNRNAVTSQGSFELHFAMISDNEHLHVFFSKVYSCFLEKDGLFRLFDHFQLGYLCYYSKGYLICSLHVLYTWSNKWFTKTFFSHYIGNFLFHFLCWSKTFSCHSTFYFVSVLCALGVISKESIAKATDMSFYRFLLILLASCLTFRSLIHFELVFMHNSISFFCRWIFRFPNSIY